MPVTVLYTIPNFTTAGSGRVVQNLATHLDRGRFRPVVAVLKRGGAIQDELEARGIPVIELPFAVAPRPLSTLLARCTVAARAFRAFHGAIWHSWHYTDDYTEPVIARLAGARAWVYTKKAMGWGSRAWLLRSYLATRIVVDNSDMPRTMFNRRALAGKTRLIPHSVDTKTFAPAVPHSEQARTAFGIGRRDITVACVGHLVPVKGHPTLLMAMSHVPDAHLLIAGKPMDPEYTQRLHEMAAELGIEPRVHFLGGVADVPALLAETDIAVLPTWARWRMEGCPVALLEAMSCGKACVATDIPGSRDLIEDGQSGVLVPPENPTALTEALNALAADPDRRARLGTAARQRVLDHYTIEREVADHEALYRELLS